MADELVRSLGAVLRRRREERGHGQAHVAAALGVRQQTVSRWEHGLAVPRPGRVVELAALLELEPAELHRLAGYLPQDERSSLSGPWHELYERMSELTRSELLLLMDRVWEELRLREGLHLPGDRDVGAGERRRDPAAAAATGSRTASD